MNSVCGFPFLVLIVGITANEEAIREYYDSELIKETTAIWQRYMIGYGTAMSAAMQETYSSKGLNIYIKRPSNPLFVTKGYFHTDNQVHIILEDLFLEAYPKIFDIRINLALTQNAIQLDSLVGKIILHCDYLLFRNMSDVVYDVQEQKDEVSPFLYEQVRPAGQIAIQVDGCKLTGTGVVTTKGSSADLGNTLFYLRDCHFNFEIFSYGGQSPPVVADYLPNGPGGPDYKGVPMERLIMKTMEAELVPKLQSVMHSYINTTAVFDDKIEELRSEQDKLFETVTGYINILVKNLNSLTISRNLGKIVIAQLYSITCIDTFQGEKVNILYSLKDVTVTGLETVYSAHTGGPMKLFSLRVSEELRYATIQVRGTMAYQLGPSAKGEYNFAVEINDVTVDLLTNFENNSPKGDKSGRLHNLVFKGWRDYQFSSPGYYNRSGESFIAGFMVNKLPNYLVSHLQDLINDASKEAQGDFKSVLNVVEEQHDTESDESDDNDCIRKKDLKKKNIKWYSSMESSYY